MDRNYKSLWNTKAATMGGALLAVDGSSSERVALATGAYTAAQVHAALDLCSGDRVLELGCGVGRIGLPLASRVAGWHGVDIADNMVARARERLAGCANVDFSVLGASNLEMLADHTFDAAYSVAVFIHMDKEDFFLYLRELKRVLKPGGRLYFDHWNLSHPLGLKRFLYEAEQWARSDQSQRKDVGRNQFTTREEVATLLHAAGFEVLALFSDSPWVQAVAMAGGEADAVATARLRVLAARERIAYTANWSRYFERLLGVIFEGQPMAGVLEWLRGEPESADREVFEIWLSELMQHPDHARACTT